MSKDISNVRSSSVPMHWRSKDAGTSKWMSSSLERGPHNSWSFLRLARKCPSRIYHSINLPTPGTTASERVFNDRLAIGCGRGKICPVCDKRYGSDKCTSRYAREWKELRKRSKFDTGQEWRYMSLRSVTERASCPLIIIKCSLVRSRSPSSKTVRFCNVGSRKSADTGFVPHWTLMTSVDDNDK